MEVDHAPLPGGLSPAPVGDYVGIAGGSFSAPDHEYPSHLELQLKVTDSGGLSDTKSLLLYPQTVNLTFQSNPTGLQLAVGSASSTTPFTRTVMIGSTNSMTGTSPQVLGSVTYQFVSWSDGGAQTHDIVAPVAPTTYTATYTVGTGLVAAYGFNEGSGSTVADASGNGNTGTISGATGTGSGKYGGALTFDGVNDWSPSLTSRPWTLTTGMTLMAWIYPTATAGGQDVLIKEGRASRSTISTRRNWQRAPASNVFVGGTNRAAEGTSLATTRGPSGRRRMTGDAPALHQRDQVGSAAVRAPSCRPREPCGSAATASGASSSQG